ncbi:Mrp/NBP35 family ATP-binding protein [Qipengyuania aurantiaca]|uniref:Iron-sulfur cluster carrier protein n=2 Tax=Qipengyuania aurantiaca TaxID=2867233 RepID=A0ABX8ZM75_9SPHN|nr:Mrp/NBP35 family ATP-binding protein [Qipengyuania aurantiaca]
MSRADFSADLPPEIAARVTGSVLNEGRATVVLDVAGVGEDARGALERAVIKALSGRADVSDVRVVMTAERKGPMIIAVGSGKGGVGKSTLTANLAIALAKKGVKVGLVDADIYGPSQPVIFGSQSVRPDARDNKPVPIESKYGVPHLSMGHLVTPGKALAWRGPMASGAITQLLEAHWSSETEVLLVDLPPGTGDVQLTMIQKFKPAGAVLVSTPQDLALIDAARAGQLFDTAGVPVIGLVENMSGYACPHCGEVSDPFGAGGVEAAAGRLELPFLGRIPLDMAIRQGSDAGDPPAAGDGPMAEPFNAIATRLGEWISARS